MKNFFVVLLLLMIFIPLSNAAIINYKVPSEIPLNEVLTIDGRLSTDENGIKCSFRIYDDQNNLVDRLTDEYTAGMGIFSSSYYRVNEPKFLRGFDYNAVTTCSSNQASSLFTVGQKQVLLAHELNQETGFIGSAGNVDSMYLIGSIGLFLVLISFLLFAAYRKVHG